MGQPSIYPAANLAHSLNQTVTPITTDDGLASGSEGEGPSGRERRTHQRIALPFPAGISYRDGSGGRSKTYGVLDNLSAGGLYMKIDCAPELGRELFFVVSFADDPSGGVSAPRVALCGEVLRIEPLTDGLCGVAVRFTRHRFLYSTE